MAVDEHIKVLEAEIQKVKAELELTKQWQAAEMGNYVRRQDEFSKEFKVLYHMVQGEGNKPGLFEEVRNLKKTVRIYGIALSIVIASSELGIFSKIAHAVLG